MSLDRHPLSAVPTKRRATNRRGHANVWSMFGAMIRAIPEEDVRAVVANHAAQFFVQQERSTFNSESWRAATGGTLTGPTTLKGCPDEP